MTTCKQVVNVSNLTNFIHFFGIKNEKKNHRKIVNIVEFPNKKSSQEFFLSLFMAVMRVKWVLYADQLRDECNFSSGS